MSGWYPNALIKNIRPGVNDPAIKPVGVILHVAVSESKSLFDYFNGPSGGIESHFYVRRDGTIEQYREAGFEADANYKANSFIEDGVRKGFLSVETQGMASGKWTDEQLASIKAIIVWAHETYKIPYVVAPDPTGPGIGYHTLFPSWTNSPGKVCPGPDRIKQFKGELTTWLKSKSNPTPAPTATVSLSAVIKAAHRDADANLSHETAPDDVRIVETALQAEGLLGKGKVDGHYGTATIAAYAAFQRSAAGGNYSDGDADGIPGLDSLTRLGKRHGFKVVA